MRHRKNDPQDLRSHYKQEGKLSSILKALKKVEKEGSQSQNGKTDPHIITHQISQRRKADQHRQVSAVVIVLVFAAVVVAGVWFFRKTKTVEPPPEVKPIAKKIETPASESIDENQGPIENETAGDIQETVENTDSQNSQRLGIRGDSAIPRKTTAVHANRPIAKKAVTPLSGHASGRQKVRVHEEPSAGGQTEPDGPYVYTTDDNELTETEAQEEAVEEIDVTKPGDTMFPVSDDQDASDIRNQRVEQNKELGLLPYKESVEATEADIPDREEDPEPEELPPPEEPVQPEETTTIASSSNNTELRIQALVWSEEPENRIVVINDNILRIGDVIGDYTLTEIENDFVLIRQGDQTTKVTFNLK